MPRKFLVLIFDLLLIANASLAKDETTSETYFNATSLVEDLKELLKLTNSVLNRQQEQTRNESESISVLPISDKVVQERKSRPQSTTPKDRKPIASPYEEVNKDISELKGGKNSNC